MAQLRVRLLPLAIIVFCIMIIGTFFYSLFEGWSFIDSLYFTVMALTTVGSADLYPSSSITKLFTVVFVLVGVFMFFYTLKIFTSYYFEKKKANVSKAISSSFEHMIHRQKHKGDVVLKVKPVVTEQKSK